MLRQDTFIVYEPLLLLAIVYVVIAGFISLLLRKLETREVRRDATDR